MQDEGDGGKHGKCHLIHLISGASRWGAPQGAVCDGDTAGLGIVGLASSSVL